MIELKEFIMADDYQPCLVDIYMLCDIHKINSIVLNKKVNKAIPYEYQVITVNELKPYLILYIEIDNNIIYYSQVKKDKINLIPLLDLPRVFKEYVGLRKGANEEQIVKENKENKENKKEEIKVKKKVIIKKKVEETKKVEKKEEPKKKKIIIKKKK
jgi:hypothetical protein